MIDEKSCKLYAQMPEHKFLVNKTVSFIRWALSKVKNPYIACSFGKDSIVMTHLIFNQFPNISVRFIRWQYETDLLNNYDEVIKQCKDRWNINLEQVLLIRQSLADKVDERFEVDRNVYDSYFLGFRMEESTDRRITIKTMGKFANMKNGLIRICPLAEWKTKDIAAYTIANNLPVLNSYKFESFESRTSSRIPREDNGIRTASLAALKNRDVNSYNHLIKLFPDAKYFL